MTEQIPDLNLPEAARAYLHYSQGDAGSASVWRALTGTEGQAAIDLALRLADTGYVWVSLDSGHQTLPDRLDYEAYDPATGKASRLYGEVPTEVVRLAEAVCDAPDEAACAACQTPIGAHLVEEETNRGLVERLHWRDFLVADERVLCEDCALDDHEERAR